MGRKSLYLMISFCLQSKNYENLLKVKGMTAPKALKIYNAVLNFEKNDNIEEEPSQNLNITRDEATKTSNSI